MWWQSGGILCFKPSQITVTEMTSEQRASLFIMHSKSDHCRIQVVIDISDIAWRDAVKMLHSASRFNLVDGFRLWSTIPHSIDRVHVKRPVDSRFDWIKGIVEVSSLLSESMKRKVCTYSDASEINTTIEEAQGQG